jgi:hypothetical protein
VINGEGRGIMAQTPQGPDRPAEDR